MQIKAQELRIGNKVYATINMQGQVVHPYEIKVNAIGYQVNAFFDYDEVQPIPLTEEWLLKAGFKVFEEGCYYIDLGDYSQNLELTRNKDEYYPVIEQEAEYHHDYRQRVNLNCLKYVHTLQNLYFALSGNELTFAEN